MNDRYKILVNNTIVFAVGNLLTKLITFFLMPIYTAVLTASQYGIGELLNNAVEIVLPIATLSIIDAVYRFSIDKNCNNKAIFTNATIIVFVGNIFIAIICCIVNQFYQYEYIWYFYILYFSNTIYRLTTQFSRGLGNAKSFASYGIINAIVLIFSNVIFLVILKGGIEGYLLSFSCGYIIAGIIALVHSKEYNFFELASFNAVLLKNMLIYSMPGIPNMISWWINSISSRYIILYYCGVEIAGLYTAASKLPAIVNVITSIFQQAWQYSTAKEIGNNDSKVFFSTVFRVYRYIAMCFCCLIFIINKLLCAVLLQSGFYSAWKYVPILLMASTVGCISTYFGTFYNAVKDNKMLMISTVVGAVCNLLLNIILIPLFGGIGGALATLISYIIIVFIRVYDIRRFIELEINNKLTFFQFFLTLLAMTSSCFEGYVSILIPFACFIMLVYSDFYIIQKGIAVLRKVVIRG